MKKRKKPFSKKNRDIFLWIMIHNGQWANSGVHSKSNINSVDLIESEAISNSVQKSGLVKCTSIFLQRNSHCEWNANNKRRKKKKIVFSRLEKLTTGHFSDSPFKTRDFHRYQYHNFLLAWSSSSSSSSQN